MAPHNSQNILPVTTKEYTDSNYKHTNTNVEAYFCGINLQDVPLVTSVILFTIGIFVTYITVFIIQESVFKKK